MQLSPRDRAKVNATLMALKDAGQDVSEVMRLAQAGLDMGTPARLSFERAFNKFVEGAPSFAAPLQRIGQLIDASDNRTVAGYNVALSRYLETGDPAALAPIQTTLQQDLAAMALRTGDAGFADGLGDTAPPAPMETSGATPSPSRPGWSALGYSPSNATAAPSASAPGEGPGASPSPGRPGWGAAGYSPSAAGQ